METITGKKIRVFRGEEAILKLLEECVKSNLSVKGFCEANNIAQASFHNWKKKYGKRTIKQTGFTSLQITPAVVVQSALFAEVNNVKIYQPVAAAYLKELLS
jgi:hypothetical protein